MARKDNKPQVSIKPAAQPISEPMHQQVPDEEPITRSLSFCQKLEAMTRKNFGSAQADLNSVLVALSGARQKAKIAVQSGQFSGDELSLMQSISEL